MFEYDPDKSAANKIKHGIDFEEAKKLWIDDKRVVFLTNYIEEKRFILTAKWDRKLWTAVYSERGLAIRIVSVRRARKNEKEVYLSRRIR